MTISDRPMPSIVQRLNEAEATIRALLSGQIDAVADSSGMAPVLLSKAQEALRRSEERYRRIVETTNDGICIVDFESKITFANAHLSEMLDCRSEDLIGSTFSNIFPEAYGATTALQLEHSRQGGPEESEIMLRRRNGSELWALLKTSAIRDTNGRLADTLVLVTDRTLKRQAEADLRKSEEQYRQIVESTSDGIIKIDAEMRFVFVNQRYAAMLGYEPGELIGTSMVDLMSQADLEKSDSQFRKTRRETIETVLRHRDGTDISVSVAVNPIVDESGREVGYLGMVRDVTERKRLQAQLMVSDRMASVGTLAAGVAHEINNPLAAITANLDYIVGSLGRAAGADNSAPESVVRGDTGLRDDIRGPLADAREAAERVRFIVRDLKIFSRTPSEDRRESVDVQAVMESSLRMAWNEIRHRARLIKDYGRVPAVKLNEARLGQVFLNLVVNAAQALPEGRSEEHEIRVTTRLEGNRVLIEVSDTGGGIPPEIMNRVFDAFFTTKPVGVGTGLGLAICHHIVTDAGGELTVQSELGKGTTFRVSLPIALEVQTSSPPLVEKVIVAGRRGRIMVVDDDELVMRGVVRILSKEHEVVTFLHATEALAACTAGGTFDLILCDLMMPDVTGMDFHRELQRVAPEQADRMVFLTGGAFTPLARKFLAETLKEHIEKPFNSATLRAIVQRHLSQHTGPGRSHASASDTAIQYK